MYHESLRDIASKWKREIDVLELRIKEANEKAEMYQERSRAKEERNAQLLKSINDKQAAYNADQSTAKLLEQSQEAASSALSNLQRQCQLQARNNQADRERFDSDLKRFKEQAEKHRQVFDSADYSVLDAQKAK